MIVNSKHIVWQQPSDFYRTPLFRSRRSFDALLLVEHLDSAMEVVSIFGDKPKPGQAFQIYVNATLANFQAMPFAPEQQVLRWALIQHQYRIPQ